MGKIDTLGLMGSSGEATDQDMLPFDGSFNHLGLLGQRRVNPWLGSSYYL